MGMKTYAEIIVEIIYYYLLLFKIDIVVICGGLTDMCMQLCNYCNKKDSRHKLVFSALTEPTVLPVPSCQAEPYPIPLSRHRIHK